MAMSIGSMNNHNYNSINRSNGQLISNIINNLEILVNFGDCWRYTVSKAQENKIEHDKKENEIVINNKNMDNFEFDGNPCVCLIDNEICVGRISQVKTMTNGCKKYFILWRNKHKAYRLGSEIKPIKGKVYRKSRGKFRVGNGKLNVPKTFNLYYYGQLEQDNNLGKKLLNFLNTGNDTDINELIERIDTSIQRYYLGMYGGYYQFSQLIDSQINKYLIKTTRTNNKLNKSRLHLKTRKFTPVEIADEQEQEEKQTQQLQLPIQQNQHQKQEGQLTLPSACCSYLWILFNDIQRMIKKLNTKYDSDNSKDDDENFNFDSDMDNECLQLYHLLRYFGSHSIQRDDKHGSIFDARDRDSDRIIASWIMYTFKTCLNGKYKQFILKYESNYKDTTSAIDTWCTKNKRNISNQFDEFEQQVNHDITQSLPSVTDNTIKETESTRIQKSLESKRRIFMTQLEQYRQCNN